MDSDRSGDIDFDEFVHAVRNITSESGGAAVDESKLRDLFQHVDTDASGTIDFAEFTELYSQINANDSRLQRFGTCWFALRPHSSSCPCVIFRLKGSK